MIISCVADKNYLRFLKPLVRSVNANSPNCSIFCWLINCSEDDEKELKSIHSDIEVHHDHCDLSQKRQMLSRDGVLLNEYIKQGTEVPLLSGGAKWLTSPYMGYCTNIRFKVIAEILKRGEPTFFLDADAIVRKDISDFAVNTGDISVRVIKHERYDGVTTPQRPLSDPGNTQYQMGVIYANPSSIRFFETCHKLCFEAQEDWDSNIVAFKDALKIHNSLNIIPLPHTYKDEGINTSTTLHSEYSFSMESHIWSGPGRRKFVNKQYVDEYLKYT